MECNLCLPTAWSALLCQSCPLSNKAHYLEGDSGGENVVSFFCVTDSPANPTVSGKVDVHTPWNSGVDRTIKKIFSDYKLNLNKTFANLHTRWTHAIRCVKDKPVRDEIHACAPLFRSELLQYAAPNLPIFVFAMGAAPLISLGFKVKKISEFQGRFLKTKLEDRDVIVFSTFSRRDLSANTGKLDVFKNHVYKFLSAVRNTTDGKELKIECSTDTIINKYPFPKTVNELRKLTDEIVMYAPEGIDPNTYPLAIDTETNTLMPFRQHLKILTFTVAWGPGKATSIPVEHPESYFTFEEVAPFIHRILTCNKLKTLQNAKFDIQILRRKGWEINNFAWDTMLAEHLLEEDKKGYYDLKEIVRKRLPEYSNYEDPLNKYVAAHKDEETGTPKKKRRKKGEIAPPKLKNAEKKLAEDKGYEHIPLSILNPYGAMDADVTWQVTKNQRKAIEEEDTRITERYEEAKRFTSLHGTLFKFRNTNSLSLFTIMRDQLLTASKVLADLELTGIPVDREYVDKLYDDLGKSILASEIKIHAMIGDIYKEFNPKSTHHLRTVLFNTGFKHPTTGKIICYKGIVKPSVTATGAESVDAAFLKRLVTEQNCPLAKEVLIYRAMNKLKDPFVSNIRALSREDGRMHTTYKITGTSTGRLSSAGENMQNIPKTVGEHNIKKIFVPSDKENNVFVNADAKAAEVRIYAAYSRDANLIKALNDGMDPHSFFASMVYNPETITRGIAPVDHNSVLSVIGVDNKHAWSYDDFQRPNYFTGDDDFPGPDIAYGKQLKALRTSIKRVVFGILYGASKNKISSIVGIPNDQAQAIIDYLFKMFPSISDYIERTKDHLKEFNFVETFFGRRRRFDMEKLTSKMKADVERKAINFKIQSTSTDIVIRVLNSVAPVIKNDLKGQVLITVHDSIGFEVPKTHITQIPDLFETYGVQKIATECPWLPVPFKWDIEVGPSYGELKSINKYLNPSTKAEIHDDLEFVDGEIKQQLAEAEE